jgi:RES domain-containing protein
VKLDGFGHDALSNPLPLKPSGESTLIQASEWSPATPARLDSLCMRLWRLTRSGHTALDGAGTLEHGGRYSPPGVPVVNFASEAGLAVLVALRYLPGNPADAPDDYALGWTEIDSVPERVPDADDDAIREWVTDWLLERRGLLAAVRSQVLPEANVVLMNPLHPDAARVPPLVTRPFSFAECLHTPPMLARYSAESEAPP